MGRVYTFRLTSEGLAEFQRDCEQAGEKGAAAFKKVADAIPGMSSAAAQAAERAKLARQRLEDAGQGASKLSEAASVATRTLGAFGLALSVGAVAAWGKQVFANTAALVDQAKQLQQTTDSLQAYRKAFEQSGSSAEMADKALAAVNQRIGQAVENTGDARRELAAWNLSWQQLAAARPEDRLALFAQGFLSIEDGARRANAEQAVFSRTGREIETVLEELAGGVDGLTEKYRRFFKTAEDARKAKEAQDSLAQSWANLEANASPAITAVVGSLAGLFDILNKVGNKVASIPWDKIRLPDDFAAFQYDQTKPPKAIPLDRNRDGSGLPYRVNSTVDNQGLGLSRLPANTNYSDALAALREEASLAGATAEKRAVISAQLDLANAKIRDGLKDHQLAAEYAGRQAVSQADIAKILTPAEQAEGRRVGLLKAAGQQAKQIKGTYGQFLDELKEEARIAGESGAQRSSELAVIRAAQVVQKQRGADEKDLVKTYDQARKILGETKTAQVEAAEATATRNELQRDIIQPLRDEVDLAGKTREEREQEVEILRLKQQYGEQAVKLSEDELRNLLKKRDLQTGDDMIRDLREQAQLAGMTADEAEREQAVLQAIHATHGNLTKDQEEEIRQLIQMRQESERWQETVEDARGLVSNFLEDLPDRGVDSFKDLGKGFLDIWKHTLAQAASYALMNPVIIPVMQGLFGGNPYAAGAGNLGGLLGGMGGFGGASGPLGGVTPDGMGNYLSGAGGLFGGGFSLSGIGSYGAGSLNALFGGGVGEALGGGDFIGTAGSGMTSFLGGLGPILGGAGLGSLAGSLVFGNKNDAGLGSMGGALAGAAIGSIIPGVGTIIGGLIGGLAGGGLGSMTGSSNQGAIANFTDGGAGSYLFKQGGGNNGQMATQAANEVSAVVSALKAQGVSISLGNITGLSIGSDKSYVYDSMGGKQKLAGGDVEGVVSAVLGRILPSATGGTSEAQTVLAHYMQSGGVTKDNLAQLTQDLGFANTLKDLDLSTKELTQSEQALKQINDQYQQLIDKAAELGLSTDKIETARQAAIQQLVQGFDDTVAGAILQIKDPLAAAAAALSAQQEQRIKEATALGADLTQVYELNALETKALTDVQAEQAAQQAEQVKQRAAQAAALAQQVDDFNANVRIGITGFTDALQAQLDAEDRAGQQRIDQAKAIGADIVQVERLNALTRQKILDDAAAQARAAAEQEAAAATQSLNAAKGGLAGLVQSLLTGSDSSLTPEQKYFTLLTQYNQAKSAVTASPNDAALIDGFQQAASALVPVAHEFLGTSQRYGALTGDILSTATQLGGDLADPSGMGRAMVSATVQGSGAIVDAIGLTNDRLDQMGKDFSKLAAQVQAILNRNAA